MTHDDTIPENADASTPPEELAATTLTCGECGTTAFETFDELAAHAVDCDGGDDE